MGSVLALSSSAGHKNWSFSTDPSPSCWDSHPAHWDSPPRWERRDGRLPNPGSFHSLHRSCKDVFPQQIEGVKMIVNKTLSSFFKVSHTLHLSAVNPSYYRFHVEHLQSDDYSKDKDAPALIGEMDSSGSLNAHALLHLTERVRARTVFQTQQSQFVTWQFEAEYRGSDFTAAVTVANPDVLRESARGAGPTTLANVTVPGDKQVVLARAPRHERPPLRTPQVNDSSDQSHEHAEGVSSPQTDTPPGTPHWHSSASEPKTPCYSRYGRRLKPKGYES
ncbi:mitochondrial import receptor subunit TOM40B isoform 3-T4 [Pholidichthys leucotaenia]